MPSDVIDLLPSSGACSFEETIFPPLAAERRLACEVVDLDFFDIGTPEELARTISGLVD
jgi:NDP-sugar pyrophosphorylase family protein